jgi:hypothetical protein
MFTKDQFTVNLDDDTVTCPVGTTADIRHGRDGDGTATFAAACTDCPLRAHCTSAADGRSIRPRSLTLNRTV